ncbi:hypothetical protein N2152v2_010647 [Parachlorella kessleri]
MKTRFVLASAALMVACLARAAPITLTPGTFNQVRVCVPYAVKLAPGAAYSVRIDAETPVQDAFRATVTSSTLKLASIGDFSTQQPIKVTVTLPAEALRSVASVGTVVLAPGFAPQQLTLSSVGSGSLVVKGLKAPNLSVSTSGTGTVVVDGTIGAVTVSSSGTSDIYLSEVTKQVALQATGTGSVVVKAASPSVSITGSLTGTSQVFYNQGQCSVTSPFSQAFNMPNMNFGFGIAMPRIELPFSNPCQQTSQIQAPDAVPQWTCGLEAKGKFDCTGGTSYAGGSGSGGFFSMASSVSGTPGTAGASEAPGGDASMNGPRVMAFDGSTEDQSDQGLSQTSVSSSGPGYVRVSSTGGGGARSLSCKAQDSDLAML